MKIVKNFVKSKIFKILVDSFLVKNGIRVSTINAFSPNWVVM